MSKIDVTTIDGFDAMSAEDKLNALLNYEIEDKSNADELVRMKNALNKASSDVADYKRQLREKQTEAERAEEERKERELEKDNLLKSLMREKDISIYQAKFLENGYSSELAKSSAEAMADGNFDTIFANLKAFNEGKEKEIKASLLKATPTPKSGNTDGDNTVTKEQFASMGYTERAKLFESNPDLYAELNK